MFPCTLAVAIQTCKVVTNSTTQAGLRVSLYHQQLIVITTVDWIEAYSSCTTKSRKSLKIEDQGQRHSKVKLAAEDAENT